MNPRQRPFVAGILTLICLLGSVSQASNEIPGKPQQQPIAITDATIHPVSGPVVTNGILVFDKGRITQIGSRGDVVIPDNARRIDASGKHVYPGLFDAYSNIGLVEINAVRATRDYRETGSFNPNVQAHVAVNPDSEVIPVTRSNGILLGLTAPAGGIISGQSAVLMLDGWTWEDMTLQAGAGMHIDWPRMAAVSDWEISKSAKEQIADRDKALERIDEFFDTAEAYRSARQANPELPLDARHEAMIPVLDGKMPLIVDADNVQQIQAAVAFANRRKLKLIIYGGYDAPHCAELLKKHDVPVIVGGVYRLPMRRSDPYDTPYTLPAKLEAMGIRYCIAGTGRFGASNVRNLPYHAAMAAGFGLDPATALQAITLRPAEILGVSDHVGSLEVGKDATLIITDGDPLETPTHFEQAFIQGRQVELNDRHKRLYHKYEQALEQAASSDE